MSAALRPIRRSAVRSRARMTAPLTRLATRRDAVSGRLRRALWTTLAGQLSDAERDWVARIEASRESLLADETGTGPSFEVPAQGEPGRFAMARRRTTVAVASEFMSLEPEWSVLLMRLVRELRPGACLELGTAFGISTAYQAAALDLNGGGSLTTIEGSAEWAERARANLDALGLGRVRVRVGPIEEALPDELAGSPALDFVFVDAEHQREPTLEHFETLLPHLADDAVVVLDDADWPEMKRAQASIARHERVASSLTIGRFGVSVLAHPDPAGP